MTSSCSYFQQISFAQSELAKVLSNKHTNSKSILWHEIIKKLEQAVEDKKQNKKDHEAKKDQELKRAQLDEITKLMEQAKKDLESARQECDSLRERCDKVLQESATLQKQNERLRKILAAQQVGEQQGDLPSATSGSAK